MAKKRATRKTEPAAEQPTASVDAFQVEHWPLDRLTRYANNPRKNDGAVDRLAEVITAYGWQVPIVVDREGVIVAGDTRYLAAQKMELATVPVHVAENLSAAQAKAYRIADNATAEGTAWDLDRLAVEVAQLSQKPPTNAPLALSDNLLRKLQKPKDGKTDANAVPDDAPERVQPGDVWLLGRHRIMCGDATKEDAVATLLDGVVPDLICTDPPYCSGGFQEAGKAAGSVGTRDKRKVANDTLSTRGFVQLLRTALGNIPARFLYCFTDWRMWVTLFDVAEGSGFGVRNMIVWNKESPGMGRGWRAQHELILWGCKEQPAFGVHDAASGNVVNCPRVANELHLTQKPVDLLVHLLSTVPFAGVIVDPFGGSGSTLMAAEKLEGRAAYLMELSPHYCDTILKRWEDFTGEKATKATEKATKGKP